MIQDVCFKKLKTYTDDRGFFREIIRKTDNFFGEGFGQLSHSLMYDYVTKAWHYHNIQTDWWYVCNGVLRVGLCDLRKESKTYKQTMDFMLGDHQTVQVVKIPPGIAHGCQTIQGPINLFYITSHIYNPDDEIRISYDDPEIEFDWINIKTIK